MSQLINVLIHVVLDIIILRLVFNNVQMSCLIIKIIHVRLLVQVITLILKKEIYVMTNVFIILLVVLNIVLKIVHQEDKYNQQIMIIN